MTRAADLARLADQLYAGPADDFVRARDEAARGAGDAGDKELAAAIRKLKRPSTAAWAVNLLVRRESGQIDAVLELAASLRAAAEALDGEQLRALTRQRRQLTSALATTARSLAHEAGVRLSAAVVDQVENMLTAAMLDPVAAQVVRTGRVLTAFSSTGLSELDLAAVVAVPEELGIRAEAAAVEPAPVGLRVVRDTGAQREAAQEALAEADGRVGECEAELTAAQEAIGALNARRLQLQGEADELRRRLAAIEDQVDQVDEEMEEAQDERDDAQAALEEAQRVQEAAQRSLARLKD